MTTTKEQAAAVKSALALYLRAQAQTAKARERAAEIVSRAETREADALKAYRDATAMVGAEA